MTLSPFLIGGSNAVILDTFLEHNQFLLLFYHPIQSPVLDSKSSGQGPQVEDIRGSF
jgi:hypothetical protein